MAYKNIEKRRENYRRYYERNREKIKARKREAAKIWYQTHKDKRKEYLEKNKTKIKEKKRLYRLNNLYKYREYGRKYYQKQKLKAFQAIKDTVKDILTTSNQNFINNNPSQVKQIKQKKKWKNAIYERIYDILGTPEGVDRFNDLLKPRIDPKQSEYHKKYYQANKDKLKEYHKEYYQANKAERKEYYKEYYQANKAERNEYQKAYREKKKRGVIIDG